MLRRRGGIGSEGGEQQRRVRGIAVGKVAGTHGQDVGGWGKAPGLGDGMGFFRGSGRGGICPPEGGIAGFFGGDEPAATEIEQGEGDGPGFPGRGP